MVVTTTVDKNYLEYLFCLVKSIRQNSPLTTVHCRLVNIADESVSNNLRDILPTIIIENDYTSLTTKRKNLRAKGELLYGRSITDCLSRAYKRGTPRFLCSDLQCYTSNTRFRNIKNLLNAGYSDVIYLDADTIVRKNIEELQPVLSKSDICCNVSYCARYPNDRCWECSFLYIKNSNTTVSFIEDVMLETESDMFNWDSDQIALERIYNDRYKDTLCLEEDISHIEDLSALHGKDLSVDSFIWAGSGTTKFTNSEFLKELSIYENLLSNK
jgi:hypothetical protein